MNGAAPEAAAKAYLRRGWSVVPVAPRSKHPLVKWEPYQRQPPGEAEIEGWFQRWPGAGVAIVTGTVSNLVVLDVDPGHGGEDSLSELEAVNGALPDTVEAISGGGGRHLYFAHPGAPTRNVVGLAPGIDLRADGGVIVAPPSHHPSGRDYRWRDGHAPDDCELAALPGWLLRLILRRRGRGGHTVEHWRGVIADGVDSGQRNNTVASLAGYLLWHGLDRDVTEDLLLCWNAARCRPPLDEDEVRRVVESIWRLHRAEALGG